MVVMGRELWFSKQKAIFHSISWSKILAITELQAQHLFSTKWPQMKFASKQNISHSSIPNEKFEIHFLFTEYD